MIKKMYLKFLLSLLVFTMGFSENFIRVYQDSPLRVSKGNLFDGFFRDPTEKVWFLFKDGIIYGFTTEDNHCVNKSIYQVIAYFEREGRDVKDIIYIIHNHFVSPLFSQKDYYTLKVLKNYGFKGQFAIYVTSSQKVIYEDHSIPMEIIKVALRGAQK